MWIDWGDFWKSTHLDMYPHNGNIYFQKKRDVWQAIADEFQLGDHVYRRTVPYKSAKKSEQPPGPDEPHRVLKFCSIHLGILLVHCAKSGYALDKTSGACEDTHGKAVFRRTADGLLTLMPASFTIECKLDPDVRRLGACEVFGVNPFKLKVRKGIIDLTAMMAVCSSLEDQGQFDTKGVEALLAYDGVPFQRFFVEVTLALHVVHPLATTRRSSLTARLLWAIRTVA